MPPPPRESLDVSQDARPFCGRGSDGAPVLVCGVMTMAAVVRVILSHLLPRAQQNFARDFAMLCAPRRSTEIVFGNTFFEQKRCFQTLFGRRGQDLFVPAEGHWQLELAIGNIRTLATLSSVANIQCCQLQCCQFQSSRMARSGAGPSEAGYDRRRPDAERRGARGARASATVTRPRKSGCGAVGRDLNSGWNWHAMK